MSGREPILEVNNLSVIFASGKSNNKVLTRAVDNISFDIYEGETFGLVGESGSGKTTTGRAIVRLIDPTSGTVRFKGKTVSGPLTNDLRRHITDNIAMIFEDPVDSLNPRMTVQEIIEEGLTVRGMKRHSDRQELVYSMLSRVGLNPEHASRYPHEFSGGQRQRIGIARALITKPSLVIADEPVSALDVSIQAQVINLLNDLKAELGLTILFIAHDLSLVKYFSNRVAVMYRGKIVELADSEDLYEHPFHPYTRSLLSAVPLPNPIAERKRVRVCYDGERDHDFGWYQQELQEVMPGHFVLCSNEKLSKYRSTRKTHLC